MSFLTKGANYKCTAHLGLNNEKKFIEYMYCLFNKGTNYKCTSFLGLINERNYIEYMHCLF